jgi:hypothetical protein
MPTSSLISTVVRPVTRQRFTSVPVALDGLTARTGAVGRQRHGLSTLPPSYQVLPAGSGSPTLSGSSPRNSRTSPNVGGHQQVRHSSHSPLGTSAITRKKVTIESLRKMHQKKEPITMITAHDFPSAHVADHAGMDMILVGDSLAMVALGMEDTSEVLLEEMLLHCRSVSRATKAAFTVSALLFSL